MHIEYLALCTLALVGSLVAVSALRQRRSRTRSDGAQSMAYDGVPSPLTGASQDEPVDIPIGGDVYSSDGGSSDGGGHSD